MPEGLTKQEVDKGIDPSVSKQYDDSVSSEEKFEDMYKIVDGLKIGMMGTLRNGIGPVHRAMAVSKRTGPDFLFLSNAHSQKFDDIESNKIISIAFHDKINQDWVSVTGEMATSSADDPRIKEIYSKAVKVWFGDLGDGVHDGGPNDPRMKLIEVKSKFISYWKHEAGALGYGAEIASALVTGKVAQTGTLRQMKEDEIAKMRSKHSSMSSS
ncbi:hypothetical protein LTR08_005568 [Meristemomyces frigidus]|nr:hypothetical protein LTR08_005568 [Meristemomyces frigidus]